MKWMKEWIKEQKAIGLSYEGVTLPSRSQEKEKVKLLYTQLVHIYVLNTQQILPNLKTSGPT